MDSIKTVLLVILFPLITSTITYFGYMSAYTESVFSRESFSHQYENGIYRYRVLSQNMIKGIAAVLEQTEVDGAVNMLTRKIKWMEPEGKVSFYLSYYIINTVFFILAALSFRAFCRTNLEDEDESRIDLYCVTFAMAVPLMQYVLVPYDYISYFLNIIIVHLFVKPRRKGSSAVSVVLPILVILATLNRETASLAVAAALTISFVNNGSIAAAFKETQALICSFLLTYLALRLYFGFSPGVLHSVTVTANFSELPHLLGILTGTVLIYMVYLLSERSAEVRRAIICYLFFSSPYILVSLFGGIMYEIRLWTPVLLNLILILIFLSRRNEVTESNESHAA